MSPRPALVVVLILAAVLAIQGFGSPPVGMANNGDYGKIIGPYSLGASTEFEYRYAPVCYQYSPHHYQWPGYYSSQQLLVALPILIGTRIFPAECYDARFTFAFQAILFAGTTWMLLVALPRASQSRWIFTAVWALAVVTVLGDAFFASHLASFYSDLAAMLGLLFLVALAARSDFRLSKWTDSLGLAAAVVLLVGSKAQHSLCAIPIVLWLAFARVGSMRLKVAAIAAVAGVFAFMATKATPPGYQQIGLYSTIFYEILPGIENPKAELARFASFGIRPEDEKYIGTYSYQDASGMQSAEFKERFEPKASYPKLAVYYLSRPSAAWRLMLKAMGEAGTAGFVGKLSQRSGFTFLRAEPQVLLLERLEKRRLCRAGPPLLRILFRGISGGDAAGMENGPVAVAGIGAAGLDGHH